MSPKTAAAFEEIKRAARAGQTRIAPCTFSPFYGRAATAAAFRMAKRECVIEVAYTSMVGSSVYRAFGIADAAREARAYVEQESAT